MQSLISSIRIFFSTIIAMFALKQTEFWKDNPFLCFEGYRILVVHHCCVCFEADRILKGQSICFFLRMQNSDSPSLLCLLWSRQNSDGTVHVVFPFKQTEFWKDHRCFKAHSPILKNIHTVYALKNIEFRKDRPFCICFKSERTLIGASLQCLI